MLERASEKWEKIAPTPPKTEAVSGLGKSVQHPLFPGGRPP